MIRQFLGLHLLAIAAHTLCFVYSFASPTGYTTHIPTELVTVKFTDTINTYYDIQEARIINLPSVVFFHGIVALVTVLFHSILYLPIHYKFANIVWNQRFFAIRWVEYSITCTLMTLSSVMSSGMFDFNFVITIIVSGMALQLIGCTIEQLKQQWKILVIIGSGIEFGIAWSLIWYTVTSVDMSHYQWIETISFLFYYGLFPLNCIVDATYRKNCFLKTDWTYNVLSITSKFALFWLQVGEVERKTLGGFWPEIQVYGLGMVLPFLVLMLGIYWTPSECSGDANATKTEKQSTFWKIMSDIATIQIVNKSKITYVKRIRKSKSRN